jgi:eukaryotic-like serine/threonine-protein kinase
MPQPGTELLIEIIGEAMGLPPGERDAFVERSCPEPEAQREAVSLIRALERAGGFMESPTVPSTGGSRGVVMERPGDAVGPYTLLEQIGEGGFGVVFSAEQRAPVQRTVALKIIKLGMDTRAVVARFQAERHALALMDHPCIAKVLDAGATETGRPYFVMELVRGEPITAFCAAHALPGRQRLEVFVHVCLAVQHAHTKGIIHRDLKPANILVCEVDGRPLPRVIDFGIAKATDAHAAAKPAFTEARQFIGTPEYMSPEQAQSPGLAGVDIDTRTDVYSLGVLLYELLTGATPLEGVTLRSKAWDEMLRMIRETDPPKPSTRAASVSRRAALAVVRSSAAALKGDLDWIVMCCLEKDRTRRYQTAESLAADIQRHLRGQAVLAAPPSRVYQLRKFVGRHRAGVSAACVMVVSLVVGLSAALWQAGIAARERDVAEARRKDTEQVADFQATQLGGIDPQLMGTRLREDLLAESDSAGARLGLDEESRRARRDALGQQLSGVNLTNVALSGLNRNIFQRTINAIDKTFGDQPRVRARLLISTGAALSSLGLYEEAVSVQSRALEICRRELGEEHTHTLEAYNDLGYSQLHSRDFDQAEANLRRAIDGRRRVLGEDARETLISMTNLAALDKARRRLAAAEEEDREVLRLLQWTGRAEDHEISVRVLSELSVTLLLREKLDEAETFSRQAVELSRRSTGDESPATLSALSNLASVLMSRGNLDESAAIMSEVVGTSRRVLGDQHPRLASAVNNLGVMLARLQRLDEAEPLHREVLEKNRAQLGEAHTDTLTAVNNYGLLLMLRGKNAEAAELMSEGVSASLAGGEAAMAIRAVLLHHEAEALRLGGRLDEAKPLAQEAVALYVTHPGWSPGEARHANTVLQKVLTARGEHAEAEAFLRSVVDRARRAQPPAEPELASALLGLGTLLLQNENFTAAEGALRECVEIRARTIPETSPERWRYLLAMSLLGEALVGEARDGAMEQPSRIARLHDAEPLLTESAAALRADPYVPGPNKLQPQDYKQQAMQRVADLYALWHTIEPGKGCDVKAAEWRARLAPPAPGNG